MNYVKLHIDALEAYKRLSDNEFGRGIRALLRYLDSGDEPDNLGREGLMYDALCAQVRRDRKGYDKYIAAQTANGKKGGRPKKPKETQENPRVSEKPKETQKSLRNNIDSIDTTPLPPFGGDNDDDLIHIQQEHDQLLAAAEQAGFRTTHATAARLIDLYAVHGLDKLLAALDACVEQGVIKLSYLRAVLDSKPREAEPEGSWMDELRRRGIGG